MASKHVKSTWNSQSICSTSEWRQEIRCWIAPGLECIELLRQNCKYDLCQKSMTDWARGLVCIPILHTRTVCLFQGRECKDRQKAAHGKIPKIHFFSLSLFYFFFRVGGCDWTQQSGPQTGWGSEIEGGLVCGLHGCPATSLMVSHQLVMACELWAVSSPCWWHWH